MECVICHKPLEHDSRSTVCDEPCLDIHKKVMDLTFKYANPKGCANCWGDLYQGCTDECKLEFRKYGEFMKDVWSLVRIVYPAK